MAAPSARVWLPISVEQVIAVGRKQSDVNAARATGMLIWCML